MTTKILLTAVLSILLTGCASKPAPLVQRAPITRIAIIPATDPTWYALDNVNALQYVSPTTPMESTTTSSSRQPTRSCASPSAR